MTALTTGEAQPERAQRVIVNPVSGERIVIRTKGADTGGRLLVFDLYLPPGAHVPARHAHPVQAEQFTVLAGRMRFILGRQAVLAAPGLGFTFAPDGVSAIKVPVQLWAGTADETVPLASNAGLLSAKLGQRAEMHAVPGAVHFSFLMPCGLLGPRELCKDPKEFDRAAFHRQFNADVARFFEANMGRATPR